MSTPSWQLVAQREVAVRLRDRNFIIGTALTLVLLLAGFLVPTLLQDGAPTHRVAVTDDAGRALVAAVQASQPTEKNDFGADEVATYETVDVADRAAAEQAVRDERADVALVRGRDGWQLLNKGGVPSEVGAALTQSVRTSALSANAAGAGTTLERLAAGSELTEVDLEGQDAGGVPPVMRYLVGLALAMIFYMAAILFGQQIASSVVEEKQSRLIEVLAAIMPVRQLLTGKVVGNTVIALGQIVLIACVALVGMRITDVPIDLAGTTEAVLWYIPFFLLGFLALACLYAAAGALASRTEDLQSTTMPMTLVLVLVFLAGLQTSGTVRTVLSFIPVASTFTMPMRVLDGDVATWELLVALLLVLLFCGVVIALATRIYERAVMHTSGVMSWRSALSAAKD